MFGMVHLYSILYMCRKTALLTTCLEILQNWVWYVLYLGKHRSVDIDYVLGGPNETAKKHLHQAADGSNSSLHFLNDSHSIRSDWGTSTPPAS